MNRNQYLQEIKNGIQIFEESYQQESILKYDEKIEEIMKDGKSFEEVIKTLGEPSKIIAEIFKENHVNAENLKKSNSGFLKKSYEQIFSVINHVVDVMSKNNAKANGKIVLDLLILILLTCLLKIPFIAVRDFVVGLLGFIGSPLIVTIWQFIVEVLYIIIAITFFLNVFKKWFENLKIQK